MVRQRTIEMLVGIFMIMGVFALVILALKVSGLASYSGEKGYHVVATFDNIGDLKARAPVTIAGVKVGRVVNIKLNPTNYRADVTLLIYENVQGLPSDTAASILTEGLLGSNYISLDPGYANTSLKNGDKLTQTHPALILENLIGQLLFKVGGSDSKNKTTGDSKDEIKT